MYFLDTHIVVWLYQKSLDLISKKSLAIIETNDIYISPFVIMELEFLFEIGKIKKNSSVIVDYLSKKIGLKIDDHNLREIIDTAVNEKWTRDPFDRIIVAHARAKDSFLISRDKRIKKNYFRAVS